MSKEEQSSEPEEKGDIIESAFGNLLLWPQPLKNHNTHGHWWKANGIWILEVTKFPPHLDFESKVEVKYMAPLGTTFEEYAKTILPKGATLEADHNDNLFAVWYSETAIVDFINNRPMTGETLLATPELEALVSEKLDGTAPLCRELTTEQQVFYDAYRECALWSSTDEDGTPLDRDFFFEDFSPEASEIMKFDCVYFLARTKSIVGGYVSQAGHDFWLTRNGHGANFLDRTDIWKKEQRDILTEICKEFGDCCLQIGDDRKLYL